MSRTVRLPVVLMAAFAMMAFAASAANAQSICNFASGASVVANDDRYLGRVAGNFDPESIFNEFGQYGSRFSSSSIWNDLSPYGGPYSNRSPFNPYSNTPPRLVKGGKMAGDAMKGGEVVGHLTVNIAVRGAIDPNALKKCAF